MTAVFSHGRLRLYLLKLLAEGPKHGYELIRLLENRFLGLYAPSAGTIYPRLARLENEGLVTHTSAGGRKTYEITDAGRAELTARAGELADLEAEIHASVADLTTLANDIEREVSGSMRDIKRELREATRQARTPPREPWSPGGRSWDWDWSGRRREGWRDRSGERDASGRRSTGGWSPGSEAPRTEAGDGRQRYAGDDRRAGPDDRSATDADLDDLSAALTELAAEARNLARRVGASDSDIRSATAVVVSALTELRRLLRR
jgi:DNA-binding PadR family transcriptional regulator